MVSDVPLMYGIVAVVVGVEFAFVSTVTVTDRRHYGLTEPLLNVNLLSVQR